MRNERKLTERATKASKGIRSYTAARGLGVPGTTSGVLPVVFLPAPKLPPFPYAHD